MKKSIYIQPIGGLGNVLFMILNAYHLSRIYNMNLKIFNNNLNSKCYSRKDALNYKLLSNLKDLDIEFVNNISINDNCLILDVPEHTYRKFELNPNSNYIIKGYYQSWKYSSPDTINLFKNNIYSNINLTQFVDSGQEIITLHVRRGDYLKLNHIHPVQSDEYYKKCLDLIPNVNSKIINVFSDDINFITNWKLLSNYNYNICNYDVEICLKLMSKADYFIIANSSLSLISWYFREKNTAKLFLPGSNWFGQNGPKWNIEDIVDMSNKNIVNI